MTSVLSAVSSIALSRFRLWVAAPLLLMLASVVSAQDGPSVEELEKLIEEQRIALEEAIANREATAAKVAEVEAALDESAERKRLIEEELEGLCEEQEALNAGSFDKCMESAED